MRNCPFAAIVEKSFIPEFINLVKQSENNTKYKIYALIAPSIIGQFESVKLGQIASGLKDIGIYDIDEIAIGADITAYKEAEELVHICGGARTSDENAAKNEGSFMTTSCCPSFVLRIQKSFRNWQNISQTHSRQWHF